MKKTRGIVRANYKKAKLFDVSNSQNKGYLKTNTKDILNKDNVDIEILDSVDIIVYDKGNRSQLEGIEANIDNLYKLYKHIFISAMKRKNKTTIANGDDKAYISIDVPYDVYYDLLVQLSALIGVYKYTEYHTRYINYIKNKRLKVKVVDKNKANKIDTNKNYVEIIDDMFFITKKENLSFIPPKKIGFHVVIKNKPIYNQSGFTIEELSSENIDMLLSYSYNKNIKALSAINQATVHLVVRSENGIIDNIRFPDLQVNENSFCTFFEEILYAWLDNKDYKYTSNNAEYLIPNEALHELMLQLWVLGGHYFLKADARKYKEYSDLIYKHENVYSLYIDSDVNKFKKEIKKIKKIKRKNKNISVIMRGNNNHEHIVSNLDMLIKARLSDSIFVVRSVLSKDVVDIVNNYINTKKKL